MKKIAQSTIAICLWILWPASAQAERPPQHSGPNHQKVLRIEMKRLLRSFDPPCYQNASEATVIRDLYEGLVTLDPEGYVKPGVALAWSQENATRWVFQLNPKARWSNGDWVTADDFVFSWQRLATIGSAHASVLDLALHLDHARDVLDQKAPPATLGIKALGRYTLELTLDRPVPQLPLLLAAPCLMPVHRPSVENGAQKTMRRDPWLAMVTNGAYSAPVQSLNGPIRVRRNICYRAKEQVMFDCIQYMASEDGELRVQKFEKHSIDLTYLDLSGLKPGRFLQLRRSAPPRVLVAPTRSWWGVVFNLKQDLFKQQGLRQALNIVVDRTAVIKEVRGGMQTVEDEVTYGVLPGQMLGDTAPAYIALNATERATQAKKLLKKLTLLPQTTLTLACVAEEPDQKKIADFLSKTWKTQLGLSIKVEAMPRAIFEQKQQENSLDMALVNCDFDLGDPAAILALLGRGSPQNYAGYNDPTYLQQLDQASRTLDLTQRYARCQEANLRLAEDAPVIPLFFQSSNVLIQPYLSGLDPCHPYMQNLYFNEGVKLQPQRINRWDL